MKSHHIPLYRVCSAGLPDGGTILEMRAAKVAKRMLERVGIAATITYAHSLSIHEYRER